MRPLKLKMTAFGPYKQTETINFHELQGNQLFVISGSTGSGKTTIFDGICFALYGSASGSDRRETRNLRSDFADDGTHTCVEMEFEIHNKRYRILRQMSHVKKGNKSPTGERYEFFTIDENGETPCVERQIVSEINRKVEQILGLTQNQFSQIVMLPQGEFRKLLTSENDNKEEILRRIFKTEPYKMISERLKQKKDAAAKAFQSEEQVLDNYLKSVNSTFPVRESALFEVVAREHYNANQFLAALEQEALFYREQMNLDQSEYQALYQKHNEKMEAYHEAKKWNSQLAELKEKEESLEAANSQLAAVAAKEQSLERAEKAGFIENTENLFLDLKNNESEKKQQYDQAVYTEKLARESKATCEQRFKEEEARSELREEAQKRVIQLQNFLPQVQDLAVKESQLKDLKAGVERAEKNLQTAETAHAAAKKEKDKTSEIMKELEGKLEVYDSKQQQLLVFSDHLREVKDYAAIQTAADNLSAEAAKTSAEWQELSFAYKKKEDSWFADQAHLLAEQLHEGEACPVCGSHEHPNKKMAFEGTVLSREELEAAKSAVDQLDNQLRTTHAKLDTLKEQLGQKKQVLESYSVQTEDIAGEWERLEKQKQQLEDEVQLLQSQKEEFRQLKDQWNEQITQVERLEHEKANCLAELNTQKSAFEAVKAVMADKVSAIPEHLRALSFLEKEIQQALTHREELENSWKAVQQQYHEAKEQLSSAAMSLQHAKANADEIAAKRQKAEQQFKEALQKSSFESETAYQQAKMKAEDFTELKQEIEEFKRSHHTLQQQVKELAEVLTGRTSQDLSQIELELADLKKGYEQALSAWNLSMDYEKKAESLAKNIKEAVEKTDKSEQKMNQITDLHDMIRGQNNLKISFERYLQIEYLEQIIQAANERLKNLSNGQFYLMRSDRQETHGKQSGLGLDVYDAYTGQTRDVKTLSGGEKFNASLCLALGMADVIQSFQGNVSIETMFIDEGFGSLDEESLNKSIDTLIDLQKSGRMIGVISHVRELKAAIPAILEVEKSKEGCSRTSFLIR